MEDRKKNRSILLGKREKSVEDNVNEITESLLYVKGTMRRRAYKNVKRVVRDVGCHNFIS